MKKFLQSYVSTKHNFRQQKTSLQLEGIKETDHLFILQDREGKRGWEKFNDLSKIIHNYMKWFSFLVLSFEWSQGLLKISLRW